MKITVDLHGDSFNIDSLNGPIDKVIENLIWLRDINKAGGVDCIWIQLKDAWGQYELRVTGRREATEFELKEIKNKKSREAVEIERRERKELARLKAKYDE